MVIFDGKYAVDVGLLLTGRYSQAFPKHQSELDLPQDKAISNCWETTTRAAFCDPILQINPALLANVDLAQVPQIGKV